MNVLTLLLMFVTVSVMSAQTKQIAHRSHSGSKATFSLSANADNMGIDPIVFQRFKPDTTELVDSTENAPSVIDPAPPETPEPAAQPVPPSEPEKPESELQVKPGLQSSHNEKNAQPVVSKQQESPPSSSPTQAYLHTVPQDQNISSVFWLAMGLLVPAVVISAVSIRRREYHGQCL